MPVELTLANHRALAERGLLDLLRLAFLARPTVASLAALAALDVTAFSDEALVYVTDQTRVYKLALLSGAAASSPDVIEPGTASAKYPRARWLRVTSSAYYGPNYNAPLHSRSSGPLKAVELYSGEGGGAAMFARCAASMPSLFIDEDGDTVEPLSVGYPGSLYRVELKYSLQLFTGDLTGAPTSILGTSSSGPYYLIGQLRKVLAGIGGSAFDLQGIDRIEIGDAQLVSEDEEERRFIHAAQIVAVCYVTNPDEDLTALAIDFTPELSSGPPLPGKYDRLNFVARGYYVLPVASLTATLASGVATIAGSAVASSPAAHTFTASRDTYCDLASDGSVTYTEVYRDAAAPAQADGTLRLGYVRTDGTAIVEFTRLCSYSEVFRTTYQIAP